ncbi:MAG: tol-pal system protein YbgF [Proteobacteria bacterium]|nr:tol-pal system protein YbgF [Pseudomonadota bacterium]
MKIIPSRLVLLSALVLALPTAAAAQRGDSVYVEDRLNQLQQTLTMMTGQIEQLQHRNAQLQQQMEKMQTDYEYRIEQLEKGGGGGAAGRPAPRPGAQAAAPAPSPAPSAGAGGGSADQLYDEAFKKLQEGDYAGAERGFRTFVQRNPQNKLAGNAQYWLGETYYARRDYQNAMTAFAEGYKVYKTSQKGPDNLLKLGITMAALNRKSDACAVFARFTQDYPRATDLQKRRIDQERQKNGCG